MKFALPNSVLDAFYLCLVNVFLSTPIYFIVDCSVVLYEFALSTLEFKRSSKNLKIALIFSLDPGSESDACCLDIGFRHM